MQINTLMTRREDGVSDKEQLAQTAPDQPDVTVITRPAWQMILIRVARVYVQTLVGFIGANAVGALPSAVAPTDFAHSISTAALLALAPAIMSLLQNTLEILTKLDVTNPSLRA